MTKLAEYQRELILKALSKVRTETPSTRLVLKTYDTKENRDQGTPREMILIPGSAEWEEFRFDISCGDFEPPVEMDPADEENGCVDLLVRDEESGDLFYLVHAEGDVLVFYDSDCDTYIA